MAGARLHEQIMALLQSHWNDAQADERRAKTAKEKQHVAGRIDALAALIREVTAIKTT